MNSKETWEKLQADLLEAQDRVNFKFKNLSSPKELFQFFDRNKSKLNILDVSYYKAMSTPKFGRLIITKLIVPENGRLYLETAYYPTSKMHYGRTRIAINDLEVYSKHYMERMIERAGVKTVQDLKKWISNEWELLVDFKKRYPIGGIDVETENLIICRDYVAFCDVEREDTVNPLIEVPVVKNIRKTLITKNEFTPSQKEIINYILDKLGTDACYLTATEVPRNKKTADNVIESTLKRTSEYKGSALQFYIENEVSKGKNTERLAKKALEKYLESYLYAP